MPLTRQNPKQLAAQQDAEHTKLEQWFQEIAQRASSGDSRSCDEVWNDFTQQLENHMTFEENELFPRYARRGDAEAEIVAGLLAEHAEVRKQIEAIGVDLQLHLGNLDVFDGLFTKLRQHARRERETLYPWLAVQKAPSSPPQPTARAH